MRKFKSFIIKCKLCGVETVAYFRTKNYCSECARIRNNENRRLSRIAEKSCIETPFDELNRQLLTDTRNADRIGVSYGKYMALKEEGQV